MNKRGFEQIKFDIKPTLQNVTDYTEPSLKRNRLNNEYSSPLYGILNLDKVNDKVRNEHSLIHRYSIKPWIQSRLAPLGILLAIERSDTKKIVFRCRHKATPEEEELNNLNGEQAKKNGDDAKSRVCCFKIRANYSKKAEKWNISIVNDKHSHNLIPNKSFANSDVPIDISHAKIENFVSPAPEHLGTGPSSEPYLPQNYNLIASQLYDESSSSMSRNSASKDSNSVAVATAAAAVAAVEDHDSFEKLVRSAVNQVVDQKSLNEKTDDFLRLINDVVLDKVAKRGVLADNSMIADNDKIRILEQVNRAILKILDKEKVNFW